MNHDELCNSKIDPPLGMACEGCELIAYVVIRERERAARDPRGERIRGYVQGVRDALNKAEAVHDDYVAAHLRAESDVAWQIMLELRDLLMGDIP